MVVSVVCSACRLRKSRRLACVGRPPPPRSRQDAICPGFSRRPSYGCRHTASNLGMFAVRAYRVTGGIGASPFQNEYRDAGCVREGGKAMQVCAVLRKQRCEGRYAVVSRSVDTAGP